jgi:hypothetical protein
MHDTSPRAELTTPGLSDQNQAVTFHLVNRLEHRFNRLEDKVDVLSEALAKLSVKSSLWGILVGGVPVLVTLAYLIIERM